MMRSGKRAGPSIHLRPRNSFEPRLTDCSGELMQMEISYSDEPART
jgi:hypothetical protein